MNNLEPKEKKLAYCVKLIKCCQNFIKKENKKYIYLSDILYPKFKENLKFIEEFDFWKEWALLGINEQKDSKKHIHQKWVKILKDIEKTMGKMGLNKTLIYTTVAHLAQENIKNEEIFKKYMKTVVENLQIYKI